MIVDIEAIADELVRELFTTPAGEAARLVLITEDIRELGGWGRGPVRDRVLEALRKAAAGAPVLEAIQGQAEAIERLGLALRATSQWFTSAASAPQILWKLSEFLDNPESARNAIKAGAGRPRS